MALRPRILLITPLPPPIHGSSMVSQTIKESKLLNEEFEMDFVNISTSRKVEEIQKASLWLYVIKLLRFLGAYFKVFWHLCTRKYDLCYLAITCHGTPFIKDYPFVMLCKLFRRRVIIHQHNKGMSKDVDKWPYSWMLPRAYEGTKVMLLSKLLYSDIQNVVEEEQILVCPNGIPNSATFDQDVCEPSTPHLLFLSNLIESKGVYVLLDACKILHDKGCEFICDFVGGTTKEINTDTFASAVEMRGLKNSAIYHGPKYGKDKDLFWKHSSAFVFPTFYKDECFPLVLLEAMQHHLPVVTTNEGGIPDIVINGETGYICERKNVQQLAEKIEILLNSAILRKQMGHAGFKRYKEFFTQDSFEKRISECLHSAISQTN